MSNPTSEQGVPISDFIWRVILGGEAPIQPFDVVLWDSGLREATQRACNPSSSLPEVCKLAAEAVLRLPKSLKYFTERVAKARLVLCLLSVLSSHFPF